MDKKTNLTVVNNQTKQVPPWANPDGSYKTDEEIARLGQEWSYKTWDAYFRSFEEKEEDEREEFFPFANDIEDISEKDCMKLFYQYSLQEDVYPDLHFKLNVCLELITAKQKEVIYLTYWERKTQPEIAKQMNTTRHAVKSHLELGQKNLKKLLTNPGIQKHISNFQRLIEKRCHRSQCA